MIDANSQFFAILTNVGMAKQANADALGIPWKITEMGVGDANGTDPVPSAAQTKLINEWRRRPLNQLKIDPINPAVLIAEQVIPADEGGKWIREIALYDADGDMVAVANCAPSFKPVLSQGSGRTQVVRMNFIVSSSGNITLKIDPAVVLATRKYVDDSIINVLPADKTTGTFTKVTINARGVVTSGSNPTTLGGYGIDIAAQTDAETGTNNSKAMTPLRVWQAIAKVVVQAGETTFGVAKIATQALTNSGVDDATFVTPKKLSGAIAALVIQATEAVTGIAKVATQALTDAGVSDSTFVTPKKMRWGFQILKAPTGYLVFPTWLGSFIIQWGGTPVAFDADEAVLFVIPFPTECLFFGSLPDYTAGSGLIGGWAGTVSSRYHGVVRCNHSGLGGKYIAFGH